jgi:hypothetical protein
VEIIAAILLFNSECKSAAIIQNDFWSVSAKKGRALYLLDAREMIKKAAQPTYLLTVLQK